MAETETTKQEEPTAADQLRHLLAADEAAQTLKREVSALAAQAPQFWNGTLNAAEHISSQLRTVIHDTGKVVTGKVRP